MGHVLVKDVDETVLRAEGAGGKILAEPMDMPEVGRMAVIADPQGAVIATFSPQGDAPRNGGTFVWDELLTTDVDDAKRFYGEVFGWTSEDKPMGPATYTIFKRAGDTDVGGLMQRPREDIPVHWTTYIATQDADATVARAKELGATILSEPMDVPKMDASRSSRIPPAPCSASGRARRNVGRRRRAARTCRPSILFALVYAAAVTRVTLSTRKQRSIAAGRVGSLIRSSCKSAGFCAVP
jgi:predicted enzyme related to lactoylglutathione lyase